MSEPTTRRATNLPAIPGAGQAAETGGQSAPNFPYIFRWNRKGRQGQRCRMLTRGGFNSCALEFEDGYRMVTSRNAILRSPDFKESVAVRNKKSATPSRAGKTTYPAIHPFPA